MTEQEKADLDFYVDTMGNQTKIRVAQDLLSSVSDKDLNTPLKDAIRSLELARQQNHKILCTAQDRVYKF